MQKDKTKPEKRLSRVFNGRRPDRTPVLSGWIAYSGHIIKLAGATEREYIKNPKEVTLKAYRGLNVDGLIDLVIPINKDDYRIIDEESYAKAEAIPLQDCIDYIIGSPPPEKIEEDFDLQAEYEKFKKELLRMKKLCGDMVWMPAQWKLGARIDWYLDFGYENYFIILGSYTDVSRRLMELAGAHGRNLSRVVAEAVKEGIYPEAILMGNDICTQRGPMISPDFMEKYWTPQLKYGLEPLLEAGCKPVWHSDGDCNRILDMLIDCGIKGFQGFQPECNMHLEDIVKKKTNEGKPLLIFGPLSVTSELPVLSPDGVRDKVREAVKICSDNADLVLFTSNTINPDVPLENVVAFYESVHEI